jgi:hypothetical protein
MPHRHREAHHLAQVAAVAMNDHNPPPVKVYTFDTTDTAMVPDGPRGGTTFDPDQDTDRLNRQCRDVYRVMADHQWHTLAELSRRTGHPQASVSARIRDLRKTRFGGHQVDKRRKGFATGTWEYRLVAREESPR